ncbi:MAG: hypothetical protein ACRC1D_05960 [Culicoidibacterales bacterium]
MNTNEELSDRYEYILKECSNNFQNPNIVDDIMTSNYEQPHMNRVNEAATSIQSVIRGVQARLENGRELLRIIARTDALEEELDMPNAAVEEINFHLERLNEIYYQYIMMIQEGMSQRARETNRLPYDHIPEDDDQMVDDY